MARMFDPTKSHEDSGRVNAAGVYPARIASAKLESTKNGTEYVEAYFQVLGDSDSSGGRVRDALFLTEKSEKRLAALCITVGAIEPFALDDPTALRGALVGKTLIIDVREQHREYEDRSSGETKQGTFYEIEPWNGFRKMPEDRKEEFPDLDPSTMGGDDSGAGDPTRGGGSPPPQDDMPF
jgi:hypothetical protein